MHVHWRFDRPQWIETCLLTCSDEDTDIKAVVNSWLSSQPESEQHIMSGWIEDHFYKAVDWVLKQVSAENLNQLDLEQELYFLILF